MLSRGNLEIEGEIEGEALVFKGGKLQANTLNGEKIFIKFTTGSQCQSIGAAQLVIKRARFKCHPQAFMMVDEIEGDQLDLSYTQAKVVRGDVVRVGTYSKVELVEYQTKLLKHSSANVLNCRES